MYRVIATEEIITIIRKGKIVLTITPDDKGFSKIYTKLKKTKSIDKVIKEYMLHKTRNILGKTTDAGWSSGSLLGS